LARAGHTARRIAIALTGELIAAKADAGRMVGGLALFVQETTMVVKSRQRDRRLKSWLGAVLLAVWALLGGGVLVEAQAPRHRIAVLTAGLIAGPAVEGLREGLAQLGYTEGKNIAYMVEDAQGEVASLANRAAKLVEAKPDVIFSVGTTPTAVAKQATTTLPIVFTLVADPLRSGFIASYASSQNNLTGITNSAGALTGKRLEILQEIAPGIKRVLILVAPQEKAAEVSSQFLAEAAPKLGIELLRYDVTSKEEIERRLSALSKGTVDAIYYVPSSLMGTNLDLLIHKAKEDRIPLAVTDYSMVEQGALVSYGADLRLLGMQAAKLVVKILKGAKPSEMPIQTPEQLLLAINLTTAKAIGLDIPRSVLERTDRFVE
jgi:putative tryptophan/tyrosine transport system substrate-binding protein